MDATYDPREVEAKWRKKWLETGIYEPDLGGAREPYYMLMMFPYPSAEGLHVGNVFAFTGADIHGRFSRMQGKDVFEPIGFDAFGIHSENFALKVGRHPKELIAQNISHFREQLARLGGAFAWNHTVESTDPAYYRWTQWLFLKLFEAGLAYRKKAPVNWCPSCKTVLADEQVIQGLCERCDSAVEKRDLEQWFFAITKYADRLLDHLDSLDWSEVVKTAQRGWIGRSDGARLTFHVRGSDQTVDVFTTRPDTLFGATFLTLAPEHPLALEVAQEAELPGVKAYIDAATRADDESRQDPANKSGVFTGAYAVHPLTGLDMPIWVASYVLGGYGTGAVMGVPAHDERDFAFARVHDLTIRTVIEGPNPEDNEGDAAYSGPGILVNSGPFDGLSVDEGKAAVTARAIELGFGEPRTTYHLRDWLISRQRYWGPPIPILYCEKCGTVPVPEKDLPVMLPDIEDFAPKGTGVSPLASDPAFVNASCPRCGGPASRETDVSDNFLDSSWYFLRYPSAHDDTEPFSEALTRKWLPVDMYIGGKEHAVLHLLYTRFICMALSDMGLLHFEEPFRKFRAHGIITKDGAKMSKSRGNVVNPDHYFDRYGADTFRAYLMFMGPFQDGGDFSDSGIEGLWRFLNRFYALVAEHGPKGPEEPSAEALRALHRTVKKVGEDYQAMKYNTALAAMMEYLNALTRADGISRRELRTLCLLLAPIVPHLAEETWQLLGGAYSVHTQPWPTYDPDLVKLDRVTLVIQVNGRVRARVETAAGLSEEAALSLALAEDPVRRHIRESGIDRTVYVPDRLLNIVVAGES